MPLILPTSTLSDTILREPDLIPVITRFGINLGTGSLTVAQVCANHGLDTAIVLTILNTFANENYLPERKLIAVLPSSLIDYLILTYGFVTRVQIPNIDRHFDMLLLRSGTDNNLPLFKRLFVEVKADILDRIDSDINEWFPTVRAWEAGNSDSQPAIVDDSTAIDDKLSDLKRMMVTHLQGQYDTNLCYAVISAIFSLAKDLRQNNRIRDRILLPYYRRLTKTELAADNDRRKQLTAREIEVLRLAAMGYINKEIANELSISFNTVLTHRRNIASKLGIKSVSGLGVYAVINGYIRESDLQR